MSSRRRSRSKERKNLQPKLRMDNKPTAPRISDPSLPAGRRREIDNVMKKARAQNSPSSGVFWDRKLLEVEAKDPNRWDHSGYKSLYLDNSSRSRSRSQRSSSSPPRRRGRSPRSPPPSRGRSPPSPSRGRNTTRSSRSPASRKTPPQSYRSAGSGRPRTPPPPKRRYSKRSSSGSSESSCCSDESCCCSKKGTRRRSRSRSYSPPRAFSNKRKSGQAKQSSGSSRNRPPSPSTSPPPPPRRVPRPTTPPVAKKMPRPMPNDRPTDPRTRPPPPPRQNVKPNIKSKEKPSTSSSNLPLLTKIKKEGEPSSKRSQSPGGDSSGSDDSGISATVPIVATTTMTLSERFGKIAQWSADREKQNIENMKITKTGSNMKVMVEEEYHFGTPPRRYSLSPIPDGHYPDELSSSGPSRMAAWDDVRVRYQYYKDLGYLRDLSLDDYVKWEEWWYKYQDWLANERHYEHWLATHGHGGRRRKKRIPASQRLGA